MFVKTLLKTNDITVVGGNTFGNGAKLLTVKVEAIMNDTAQLKPCSNVLHIRVQTVLFVLFT